MPKEEELSISSKKTFYLNEVVSLLRECQEVWGRSICARFSVQEQSLSKSKVVALVDGRLQDLSPLLTISFFGLAGSVYTEEENKNGGSSFQNETNQSLDQDGTGSSKERSCPNGNE